MLNLVLGEFLGTLVLILFGGGVVAACLLEKSKAKGAGWIVITAGWGMAVMLGIITAQAFGAPGAINPVGPMADMLRGKRPMNEANAMMIAEFAGAFCGATLVWLFYYPHWAVTPDADAKRGVFCTAPAIRHMPANFFCEFLGTFALVFLANAIDEKYLLLGGSFMSGCVVWAIGMSLGAATGYAINPARDLAPRLAHQLLPIAGKGDSDWGYAWIPVIGPFCGGIAAALAYSELQWARLSW